MTIFISVEKAMAPHSSTLAWEIPWMEEPGRLQSMGLQRVGHHWATSLSLFTFLHWRKKWQPTPVLLPGKFHGWRSRVGYSPWGHNELDTTEQLHFLSFYISFWRRKWQPTPVFLPGESHGWRGLVGYSLWGCKESNTTKQLTHTHTHTHTRKRASRVDRKSVV